MRRAAVRLRLAVPLVLALSAYAPAQAETALALVVKAAFVTKFAGFVTWPERGDGPLNLCVLGDRTVVEAVQHAAWSGAAALRTLIVVPMALVEPDSDCAILYATGTKDQAVGPALEAVKAHPVLTITDSAFGPTQGMIHFVASEDRVRFQIDSAAASHAGLTVSSKLLALALSVKR